MADASEGIACEDYSRAPDRDQHLHAGPYRVTPQIAAKPISKDEECPHYRGCSCSGAASSTARPSNQSDSAHAEKHGPSNNGLTNGEEQLVR
jgi:hypothetical protein